MKQQPSPFACHVFVCTNDRNGARESCSDYDCEGLRNRLKKEVKERGWKGQVRVSKSGCLGFCVGGPHIVVYPQQTWYAGVQMEDVHTILSDIAQHLDLPAKA